MVLAGSEEGGEELFELVQGRLAEKSGQSRPGHQNHQSSVGRNLETADSADQHQCRDQGHHPADEGPVQIKDHPAGSQVALAGVDSDGGQAVQASGGVSGLTDLEPLSRTGVSYAITGKALLEGCFTVAQAMEVLA